MARPSDGAEKAGFLAADVRPLAADDAHFALERGAEERVADQPRGPGLVDGVLQHALRARVFEPGVDDGLLRPDRVRGQQNPFELRVRVALDQFFINV